MAVIDALFNYSPWPTVSELASLGTRNKKLDFTAIYFENKESLGARYGWRQDPWYLVKQPNTPRALAKVIWAQWERRYNEMTPFLDALKNYVRDPSERARTDWGKYKAIIDLALAGWSEMLSSTEVHNFWTSLAALAMRLNAVQGVPTNQQLITDSLTECVTNYAQCYADAKKDLGIPDRLWPDFGPLFAMLKWGSIALAGVWVYGQIKNPGKGKRR